MLHIRIYIHAYTHTHIRRRLLLKVTGAKNIIGPQAPSASQASSGMGFGEGFQTPPPTEEGVWGKSPTKNCKILLQN